MMNVNPTAMPFAVEPMPSGTASNLELDSLSALPRPALSPRVGLTMRHLFLAATVMTTPHLVFAEPIRTRSAQPSCIAFRQLAKGRQISLGEARTLAFAIRDQRRQGATKKRIAEAKFIESSWEVNDDYI